MSQFIPADPFDIVIFGGTGDLARRKLLPALFHRERDGQIQDPSRIIAVSRGQQSTEDFVALVLDSLRKHLVEGDFDEAVWQRFARRLHYIPLDATSDAGWPELAAFIEPLAAQARIFYLATAPALFAPIATRLGNVGLVHEASSIVLEKPVGRDLASALAINNAVCAVFPEERIFRIDHYLGKETVQNLLALRFGNSLFEHLWSRATIDHVQITVAESLGVGSRGEFYDRTGALRDMVQNHIMQLLCLVAMEPPASMHHDAIRDEKIKVLRSLRPIGRDAVKQKTVRGQYRAGAIDGTTVPGYAEDLGATGSTTETFVALKVDIDNWRWANTPFYIRTGKRLESKSSEISIQFTPVPHSIFPADGEDLTPNRLTIRLQPNEGVRLSLMTKEPGPGGFALRSLPLDLSFSEAFSLRYPDAYERLLMEAIRGNPALFMRRDEVEAAWAWIEGIIDGWSAAGHEVSPYVAGTWGPDKAAFLLDRDGRAWGDSGRG